MLLSERGRFELCRSVVSVSVLAIINCWPLSHFNILKGSFCTILWCFSQKQLYSLQHLLKFFFPQVSEAPPNLARSITQSKETITLVQFYPHLPALLFNKFKRKRFLNSNQPLAGRTSCWGLCGVNQGANVEFGGRFKI